MTTVDRLRVVSCPVTITPESGDTASGVRQRLRQLEAHVRLLLTAIQDMRNGLDRKDNPLLTSGVMNSRNWAATVVLEHC